MPTDCPPLQATVVLPAPERGNPRGPRGWLAWKTRVRVPQGEFLLGEWSHLGQSFSAGSRANTSHRGRQSVPGASLAVRGQATLSMTVSEAQFSFPKELWGPRTRASGTLPTIVPSRPGQLRDAPPPLPPRDANGGRPIRERGASPTRLWPRPPSLRKGARAEPGPERRAEWRAGFSDGRRRLCCRFSAARGSLERRARTDVAGREGAQTASQRPMLK